MRGFGITTITGVAVTLGAIPAGGRAQSGFPVGSKFLSEILLLSLAGARPYARGQMTLFGSFNSAEEHSDLCFGESE